MDRIEQRSISLSWTPPATPNGTITQYELQYNRSGGISTLNITNTSITVYTIGELSPAVMYRVQLRAYTRVGAGPFITQSATTLQCKLLLLFLIDM